MPDRSHMRGARYAEYGDLAKFYGFPIDPRLNMQTIYADRKTKEILGFGMGLDRKPVLFGADPAYFERVPDELADTVERYVRRMKGWERAVLKQRPDEMKREMRRPQQLYRKPYYPTETGEQQHETEPQLVGSRRRGWGLFRRGE